MTQRPNTRGWAIAGALVVIAGLVVALVSGGGSGASSSSSGADSSAAIVGVTRATAANAARLFATGVDEENLSNFEDLFKGGFRETIDLKTCTSARQPMDRAAAIADWHCMFAKAGKLQLQLSAQTMNLATNTLRATYLLSTGQKPFAAGTVRFHLIPGPQFPRMDRVDFTSSRGTFVPPVAR